MRHLPTHDKPGLGDAFWRQQKRVSEQHMRGFDDLSPEVRAIVRATGTMPTASDDLAMTAEPPAGERLRRRRRRA